MANKEKIQKLKLDAIERIRKVYDPEYVNAFFGSVNRDVVSDHMIAISEEVREIVDKLESDIRKIKKEKTK